MKPYTFIRFIALLVLLIVVSCEKEKVTSDNFEASLIDSNYIPIPENDVTWISKVGSSSIDSYDGKLPTLYRTVTNQHYFSGDTILNDTLYKKLYNHRIIHTLDRECDSDIWDSLHIYSGAFRQDIQEKEVYFIFASENIEKKIYDFNLNIDDDVNLSEDPYTASNGSVVSIDSFLIDNRYHKEYYILQGGCLNCYARIEGVGSSNGLIMETEGSLYNLNLESFIFKYKGEEIDILYRGYNK